MCARRKLNRNDLMLVSAKQTALPAGAGMFGLSGNREKRFGNRMDARPVWLQRIKRAFPAVF